MYQATSEESMTYNFLPAIKSGISTGTNEAISIFNTALDTATGAVPLELIPKVLEKIALDAETIALDGGTSEVDAVTSVVDTGTRAVNTGTSALNAGTSTVNSSVSAANSTQSAGTIVLTPSQNSAINTLESKLTLYPFDYNKASKEQLQHRVVTKKSDEHGVLAVRFTVTLARTSCLEYLSILKSSLSPYDLVCNKLKVNVIQMGQHSPTPLMNNNTNTQALTSSLLQKQLTARNRPANSLLRTRSAASRKR
uniref:Uncharacterized protein n=1 Tax=Timema shepardi TaxID=629360 RepID=A0A7R9B4Z0_TIMSH|nr:unnamed protein product [Timema shepardi]